MDRIVRQLNTSRRKAEVEQLRPFSDFADQPNIVLLGDPGAGKTHTFIESASASGGRYVTARAFLVTPASKSDKTLFIDRRDGPMLEALKNLNGETIHLPRRAKDFPDPDRLAVRFEKFKALA